MVGYIRWRVVFSTGGVKLMSSGVEAVLRFPTASRTPFAGTVTETTPGAVGVTSKVYVVPDP